MKRNPIKKCRVCGKPIVRMVRNVRPDGTYKLIWSYRTYCSNACRQKAYRRRRLQRKFDAIDALRNAT